MNRGALIALCALFAASTRASSQDAAWQDPSPHTKRLIAVADGVQLEVLDWGGSGSAVVLLAGLGATAHYYDDFARSLTAHHRVVGITRRGHRGSSAAPGGYEFARLAEDVVRVMDSLAIPSAVIIGHSFAGEEMHVLGAHYAARVRGLVYVDAAFDRGDDREAKAYGAVARTVPAAPGPRPDDLVSFAALRAYLDTYGVAGPEGYLRTRYRANSDGTITGAWSPERPVMQAMTKAMQAGTQPYNPEPIHVPALAIYAAPKSADDLMRRGSSDRRPFPELAVRTAGDSVLRESVTNLFVSTRELVQHHQKWFERFAERGRVVELSGSHDLVLGDPRGVLEHIEAFIASLPTIR